MAMELCTDGKDCIELFNLVAVSAGVLLGVLFYWKTQFVSNYENLNDRFLDFMQLQIAYPGLGTDTYDHQTVDLTDAEEIARRRAIFEFLCSLLERAFLYLNFGFDRCLDWKKYEWEPWDKWIGAYCKNPNFVEFWGSIQGRSYYAPDFVAYLQGKIDAKP
jgi:hypothetical protein